MKILGIHFETHDTGAAIINNGEIEACIAEERLSRIKEDGNFPNRSIDETLLKSKTDFSQLDIISVSGESNIFKHYYYHWMYAFRPFTYSFFELLKTKNILLILKTAFHNIGIREIIHAHKKRSRLRSFLKRAKSNGFTGKIEFVSHDRAHAVAAYYSSGYDNALLPVFEGYSFKNASSVWIGGPKEIRILKEFDWPHSPGQFYRCVTMLLGFSPRRHAGKITGLAAYGDKSIAYDAVKKLFTYKKGELVIHPKTYVLQYEYLHTKKIPAYLSSFSREDLAAAFQTVLEEALVSVISNISVKEELSNVSLSGGVAGNVKLNQRIASLESVSRLHIHPGMSDTGQALGAALNSAYAHNSITKRNPLKNVYFGTSIDDKKSESLLKKSGLSFCRPEKLAEKVGKLISEEKVVAVCQGRMEYGPRALGNRSILYSPAKSSVNDWLNKQLNRTEFMPFAPVTLDKYAKDCYDNNLLKKVSHAAEFMTTSINCSEEMKKTQPAVVHVDGTARPQIITREVNAFYYDILVSYHSITSIPSLVNTSFNMHEEPIVCSEEDAIRSFQASKIDYLVLGSLLVSQK